MAKKSKIDAEGEKGIKAFLFNYQENRLGNASIFVNKSDFIWPDFFILQTLKPYSAELIKLTKDYLQSSMELFKWRQGKHPKFCRPLAVYGQKEKPFENYSDTEFDEMENAKPWECFPHVRNSFELIRLMRHEKEFAPLFDEKAWPLHLAILLSEMPKTPENFMDICSGSGYLAATLFIKEKKNSIEHKNLKKMRETLLQDKRTPEEKQKDGQKKGGMKTGEIKKRASLATKEKIQNAYFECLNNGERPILKTLSYRSGYSVATVKIYMREIKKS